MMKMTAIAVGLWAVATGPVLASNIDDQTVCSAVVEQLKGTDENTARDITLYIRDTLDNLDIRHTDNGDPGIMAGMSDKGLSEVINVVIGHCINNPNSTVYDATAVIYRKFRQIAMAFGLAN